MPAPQKPEDAAPAVDPKQAALDKEAEKLEAKAEDAQEKADALAADAQKAEEHAEDHGQPRAVRCPHAHCRERLERYAGDNPHKFGSYVCPNHGRIWVSRGEIVA